MLPAWFDGLVARARETDGQPPFSDQSLVDARTGAREFVSIGELAAALVSDTEVELVVDPDARRRGHATALLETVVSNSGPGLLAWAHGDHPASRVLAERFGFEPVRRLLQLRLDLDRWSSSSTGDGGAVRGFRPGVDDAAWLDLNGRAFADHPEQGSVSQADLDELESESWFDADEFLLLEDGGTLIGYCWLKIDPSTGSGQATVGELYVVGVSPERQGEGLGRRLVEAGLSRLQGRGIRSAALYVEAENSRAVRLYEGFGFTEYTVDVQYRLRG